MPFSVIVNFFSKSTLYLNLVNGGIERRAYFVNLGITCPAVAPGRNNGSRKLPVWLLFVSVLFGIPINILFWVGRLLSHTLVGVSMWLIIPEYTIAQFVNKLDNAIGCKVCFYFMIIRKYII